MTERNPTVILSPHGKLLDEHKLAAPLRKVALHKLYATVPMHTVEVVGYFRVRISAMETLMVLSM
jgi:hypothetical protein